MFRPEEIASRQFLISLRGYDREEVATFLQQVAEEVGQLHRRVADLETELQGRLTAPGEPVAVKDAFRLLGEETTRILVAAEEAAEQIRRRAVEEARSQLDTAAREATEERETAHRQAVEELQRARRMAADELDRARQSAATRLEQARQEAERLVTDGVHRREVLETGLRDLAAARNRLVADLEEAVTAVAELTGRLRAPETEPPGQARGAGQAPPAEDADVSSATVASSSEPGPAGEGATAATAEAALAGWETGSAGQPQPAEMAVARPVRENATGMVAGSAAADTAVEPPAVEVTEPSGAAEPELGEAGAVQASAAELAVPAGDEAVVDRLEPGPVVQLPARGAVPGVADVASQELRGEVFASIRPGMLRRLKRTLQDVQNGVLDTLRRSDGRGQPAAVMPGDDDLAALTSVGEAFLSESYRAGVADGATLAGRPQTDSAIDPSRIGDAARGLRDTLAHEIAASLQATVRAGLEAGEDLPSLSERISEVFRDLKGPVAETVVDESLLRVYELGVLDAWRGADVTARVWVVGEEPRCPESRCRANAEEGPVPLDRAFPSGDLVPPAHPGCTCTLAPA